MARVSWTLTKNILLEGDFCKKGTLYIVLNQILIKQF